MNRLTWRYWIAGLAALLALAGVASGVSAALPNSGGPRAAVQGSLAPGPLRLPPRCWPIPPTAARPRS